MPPMWRLAIRNWSASPGRLAACMLSVALGVAIVVTITSFYEATRQAITEEVIKHWLGSAHLSIQPPGAHWGSIEARAASPIRSLDNVKHVAVRLRRRVLAVTDNPGERFAAAVRWRVDAIGIRPEDEMHFYSLPGLIGRMIEPGERGVAVVEDGIAEAWHVTVGDTITLATHKGGPRATYSIVGTFMGQRIAEFQKLRVYLPIEDVWALKGEPGAASAIDVMLEDTSPEALEEARVAVEAVLDKAGLAHGCRVETASARRILLDEADRLTRLVLMLVAAVALLTSFFIILTTMGMSLFARRATLGVMRCVGLTRMQLAGMLLVELLPVGVIGTGVGVVIGVALTRLVAYLSADVFLTIDVNIPGVYLAVTSGLLTTLLSAAALIVQISRVTPLQAVYAEARAPKRMYPLLCAPVGLLLLVLHEQLVHVEDASCWLNPAYAAMGTSSLYLGYVLLVPSLVVALGPALAWLSARLFLLHPSLVLDPFVRAPWRNTAVCWILMVGLSLIVYLGIGMQAVTAVWNFPGRLPETFVWSKKYVQGKTLKRVRAVPGVKDVTAVVDVDCRLQAADGANGGNASPSLVRSLLGTFLRPVFVAGDSAHLLDMMKVVFVEGTQEEALRKLSQGGYILIPSQASFHHDWHLGDRVTVTVDGMPAEFEIAGVVQSPALDLAVTAFQATSYVQFAAASAILGTRKDLLDKFDLDVVSMMMVNLDLPKTEPPPEFYSEGGVPHADAIALSGLVCTWTDRLPNQADVMERVCPTLSSWAHAGDPSAPLPDEAAQAARRFALAAKRASSRRLTDAESRWSVFRERLVLFRIADTMERPDAIVGSLRRLKSFVDETVRHATTALTWIPSIALMIGAIGVANLMTIGVHLRSRQLAVLRATGAVKSQVVRLVLAEALALGLLGGVIGVALGLHEAWSDNRLTAAIIAFHPEYIVPWSTVARAVCLTLAVSLVSAALPARYAARNNVVSAMQRGSGLI